MTLARMIRVNKVPSTFATPGLREMEEKDIAQVADLFTRFMKRFEMVPLFEIDEIRHQFLSGIGTGAVGDGGPGRRVGQVTWTFVVEVNRPGPRWPELSLTHSFIFKNPDTKKITDFFSFYSLPSTVIGNTKNPVLEAAYLYYYASDTAFGEDAEESGKFKKRLETVIGDALVVANDAKFDVFNALTLMDNVPILQDLKVCFS